MSKTKRIITAIVVFIAIAAFLVYLFYPAEEIRKSDNTGSRRNKPDISREGELYFLDNEGRDTLKRIVIEIADTPYERQQGLMYRHNIPDSTGMLFIFEEENPQSFWMKNTPRSLDIIYLNSDKEIVSIHKHTVPYSESPIPSGEPAKYVVEVPNGFTDQYDIQEGDMVDYTVD